MTENSRMRKNISVEHSERVKDLGETESILFLLKNYIWMQQLLICLISRKFCTIKNFLSSDPSEVWESTVG